MFSYDSQLPNAWEALGTLADILSVVGFLVTLWLARTVRRLQASYFFRARVSETTAKLTEIASRISTLAGDFVNTKADINVHFRQMAVLVESLAGKSNGGAKHAADALAKRLKNARVTVRDDVTDLYADVQALIFRYTEILRDRDLER